MRLRLHPKSGGFMKTSLALVLVCVSILAPAASAQCDEWAPFAAHGADDSISAMIVFDDGSGPALYAGGAFTAAGGTNASRVARWDGTSWSALGSGIQPIAVAA